MLRSCALGKLSWVTACLTFSAPLFAAEPAVNDWRQFRGPGGRGVAVQTGLPTSFSETENLLWAVDLPGAGTSSPVVVGDRIFLTCYSGYGVPGEASEDLSNLERQLLCLNRDDGAVLWSRDIETVLPEQPTIRDDHGYASSTPVADDENVYAFFGKAGVFAFDHQGQPLWKAAVGENVSGWGSAASPVLAGDLLIVNASVECESLIAFDKRTGAEAWRVGGIREAWNTPHLVSTGRGKTELIVTIPMKALAFEPASGKSLWTCDTDIQWYMAPSVVAEGGVVYIIGGRSGNALAVRAGGKGDVTATHRIWTGLKGSNVSSPVYYKGHLYWMNDNQGTAYCADAKTGELKYETRVPGAGQVYASPLLADGKLYYTSRDGQTFVLRASPKFELLATNRLGEGETFNAGFAVTGKRLLLRSTKRLYCLGEK